MDASVYLTGDIYDDIYSSDLFLFKGPRLENINCEENGANISSWFIFSKSSNPVIMSVREMLFQYWKDNNKLIEYKLLHWFFTIAFRVHTNEWCRIPYYPSSLPQYLFFSIFNRPYNEEIYKRAINLSNIHKLSWHKECVPGSFFEILLEQNGFK